MSVIPMAHATVSYRDTEANSSRLTHAMDIVMNRSLTLAPHVQTAQLTAQKPLCLSVQIHESAALDPF